MPGPVITGVVANDLDSPSLRVLGFDLLQELDRGLGVDGVVIADNGAKVATIDDAIDVEPLPAGVAANFMGVASLDRAVAGHRIVVGMGGVHEINAVARLFRRLETMVYLNKSTLLCSGGLAWDECRLFVNET